MRARVRAVERDLRAVNPSLREAAQELLVEVPTGGDERHREAPVPCEREDLLEVISKERFASGEQEKQPTHLPEPIEDALDLVETKLLRRVGATVPEITVTTTKAAPVRQLDLTVERYEVARRLQVQLLQEVHDNAIFLHRVVPGVGRVPDDPQLD